MSKEIVSVTVPGKLKYCHFISDASELLFKSKIKFYSEELYNNFIQDMRIVMYELFSNSVTHSKSEKIIVCLEVDDNFLNVIIKTKSVGFGIKQIDLFTPGSSDHPITFPPYPEEFIGNQYVLYRDYENEVFCTVNNQFDVSLINKKNIYHRSKEADIPEHYGLNLITKLVHQTKYFRDESGIDNFVITKQIR